MARFRQGGTRLERSGFQRLRLEARYRGRLAGRKALDQDYEGLARRRSEVPQTNRHSHRADQGQERLQGRAALLGPEDDAGLVGLTVLRPQGPAHRVRPVRQALSHYAAGARRS